MYLVCYSDWEVINNYFFNRKSNAVKKYNEIKKWFDKDEYRVKEKNWEQYKEITDSFSCDKAYMYEITTED